MSLATPGKPPMSWVDKQQSALASEICPLPDAVRTSAKAYLGCSRLALPQRLIPIHLYSQSQFADDLARCCDALTLTVKCGCKMRLRSARQAGAINSKSLKAESFRPS